MESQTCSYYWDPIPPFEENFRAFYAVTESILIDSESIFISGTSIEGGFYPEYFYFIQLDRESCTEVINEKIHIGLQKFSAPFVFQNDDYIFQFLFDISANNSSPNAEDFRVIEYNPSFFLKVDKRFPSNNELIEIKKDGNVFSITELTHSGVYLEDEGQFFISSSIIHEDDLDLLFNDPEAGFVNFKPGWFLIDTSGVIIEYDIFDEDESFYIWHHMHYDSTKNKIYGIGGQMKPKCFPSHFDNNGLLSVFDLNTRSFDYIQSWNNSPDTLMRAESAYWDGNGFIVHGSLGWNIAQIGETELFVTRINDLAAGQVYFESSSFMNIYSEHIDYEIGRNDIFYKDSDSTFLMSRDVTGLDTGSVDKDYLWIERMHLSGFPLDTFLIEHGFDFNGFQYHSATRLDTVKMELFLLSSFNDFFNQGIVPVPIYPKLIKVPLQDLLDMITDIEEVNSERFIEESKIVVYPTVFENSLNLYNKLNQDREVVISLYNVAGKVVLEEKHLLNHHEFITINDLAGLTSGSYFYSLKIDGKQFSGQLIKK
jgi:hypothetical protein